MTMTSSARRKYLHLTADESQNQADQNPKADFDDHQFFETVKFIQSVQNDES